MLEEACWLQGVITLSTSVWYVINGFLSHPRALSFLIPRKAMYIQRSSVDLRCQIIE